MNCKVDLARVRPYYDALGDGVVQLSFTLPVAAGRQAEQIARRIAANMNLSDVAIVEQRSIAPDFTFFIVYGKTNFAVAATALDATEAEGWDIERIEQAARPIGRPLVVVGATLESDAHTVGLDAIFNLKGFAGHPGLEHYACFRTFNLGAQVPFHKVIEAVRREAADALLISQTVTQKGMHVKNLTSMAALLEAERLREGILLVLGGPHVTPELAKELGYDAGFGRGALPEHVAALVVQHVLQRLGMAVPRARTEPRA
ncbi:MAG: OAM dimerization domain-containing protein [Acidobacteriota bacterium]